MAEGFARFKGQVLVILSGNDLTASEFSGVAASSKRWRRLLRAPRVVQHRLAGASHTFSRREWRDQVSSWTSAWVRSW
jgi:hypothetical protein